MANRHPDLPSLSELTKGRVYKLDCRNLVIGVFDGIDSFIGIRTKFGRRFLDSEIHWDACEQFGTVSNVIYLEIDLPSDIEANKFIGGIPGPHGNTTLFKFLEDTEEKIRKLT